VVFHLPDGQDSEPFQLVPSDPKGVAAFHERLVLARELTRVLATARNAFASGAAADYQGAAKKLRHLLVEWNEASTVEFREALNIGSYLRGEGFNLLFGPADTEVLSEFALEAIQKLYEAAEPKPAPLSPPSAPEPPARETPDMKSVEAAAAAVGNIPETATT
jgi:hypothetical protein